MDATHHPETQAGQVLVITTPAKEIRTNVIVSGIMTIIAAFFFIYIAQEDGSTSQSDLMTMGWMMGLMTGSFALPTILQISTWKLDERGILWMPLFRKHRYLAWDEIDRISRLGGEVYSTKSKTTIRFIGMASKDGKQVQTILEERLGDRFDFEPMHQPVRLFSHPIRVLITIPLIGAWYGLVLRPLRTSPLVETLTPLKILALVFAPALLLIPFLVQAFIKANRERDLPRK
jgi:hypothetical protein